MESAVRAELFRYVIIRADVIQYGISYNLISKAIPPVHTPIRLRPIPSLKARHLTEYSIPSEPAGKSGYAIWWEYDCTDGVFSKRGIMGLVFTMAGPI